MRNFQTLVHPEMGGKMGFTVEFVGNSGDVVSVQLRQDAEQMLNRVNAVEKARELLGEVAHNGTSDDTSEGDNPDFDLSPRRSARSAGDTGAMEEQLDTGLYDSFPASDPVSITITTVTGSRKSPTSSRQ